MNGIVSVNTEVELNDIRPLICELRGQPVMLDRDLAVIYHVMTGRLNEAVKRNLARFPPEFMFQLSDAEMRELIANCDRFRMMKHSPSRMYAFTEQGVAMLSAVLKSDIAIRESIRIMKAFVSMRRILAAAGPTLASLATRVEANERRQITDQSRNEARFDEIFAKMNADDLPLQSIFYQNKFWDAKSLLIKFIRRAKKELIVIDAYPGVATLDMLAKRGRGVKIELVTHSNGELEESDFEAFGAQCGKFTKTICGICHDRFIIVDQKEIFWTGASLKDAGRLTFAAAKMGAEVIPGLLESIRKATSEQHEYGKGKQSGRILCCKNTLMNRSKEIMICSETDSDVSTIAVKDTGTMTSSVKTDSYSIVSFFCGCGGLDLGFIGNFTYKGEHFDRTKFNILKAYDFNKDAIATYRANISENAEQMDLSDYDVNQIPCADILIGGFPCQDFANCGPRRGLNSKRGRLYEAMIKYAKKYQPLLMIGENVPGLETIGKGKVLETIMNDIKTCGYNVEIWRLFAPDFGVPQTRRRLIIIAVRNDMFALHGFPKQPVATFNKDSYRTTKWAIGDLERITDNSVPNQAQYSRATLAIGGTGQGDDVCHADAPSYTIRANSKGRVEFHYALDRRLTVRECARIQTFPDEFVFPHNNICTNILEIGNAVPPILGNVIARSIQQFMEEING